MSDYFYNASATERDLAAAGGSYSEGIAGERMKGGKLFLSTMSFLWVCLHRIGLLWKPDFKSNSRYE